MTETVYIETSILGYLTARSTDNLILAATSKSLKTGGSRRVAAIARVSFDRDEDGEKS